MTKAAPHCILLIPSMACQAGCRYCFGPNKGPVMPAEVFDLTLAWMKKIIGDQEEWELVFHGGEPLLAGYPWFERALSTIHREFGSHVKLHCQSNLWLLNDAFCELFQAHDVSLWTSLDGPEPLTDGQRGPGYFQWTMRGIEMARKHCLPLSLICTFTKITAPHWRSLLEFFIDLDLPVDIHGVVGTLGQANTDGYLLSPDGYGELLVKIFDFYLLNRHRLHIPTLNAIAHSISAGRGLLCTFSDCLGSYLTIASDGSLYTCNRFTGDPRQCIGNVKEAPTLTILEATPAWQSQQAYQQSVAVQCTGCPYLGYCRGGCPYQAEANCVDRYCAAYKRLFSHIIDRATAEIFSEVNLQAIQKDGPGIHGLLHTGTLLKMMRGGF